jgi:hypothetical protein
LADTYGGGEEEDIAHDKDRAGVFQSVRRTFADGSIGLEKSDLAKDFHVDINFSSNIIAFCTCKSSTILYSEYIIYAILT